MKPPEWWDEARVPIAFLIAPLAVPLLALGYLGAPTGDKGVATVLVFGTAVGMILWLIARPDRRARKLESDPIN